MGRQRDCYWPRLPLPAAVRPPCCRPISLCAEPKDNGLCGWLTASWLTILGPPLRTGQGRRDCCTQAELARAACQFACGLGMPIVFAWKKSATSRPNPLRKAQPFQGDVRGVAYCGPACGGGASLLGLPAFVRLRRREDTRGRNQSPAKCCVIWAAAAAAAADEREIARPREQLSAQVREQGIQLVSGQGNRVCRAGETRGSRVGRPVRAPLRAHRWSRLAPIEH